MKFLCDNCKAKYQIGDDKVAGKTVRMKCRRCGHLIQVNASVTEGSVARRLSPAPFEAPEVAVSAPAVVTDEGHAAPSVPFHLAVPARGAPARALEAAPERQSAPVSSPRPVAAVLPAPRPAVAAVPRHATPAPHSSAPRPGAAAVARPSSVSTSALSVAHTAQPKPAQGLTGAFARSVADQAQPFAHVTPSDDWYVGVAGVPVGPIRLAAIREKASIGQVDGDSLVWRESFDEWQPLRNFPELLELVEEGRHSIAARRPSGMSPRATVTSTPPTPSQRTPTPAPRPAAAQPTPPAAPVVAPPVAAAPSTPAAPPPAAVPFVAPVAARVAVVAAPAPAAAPAVASLVASPGIAAPAPSVGPLADPFGVLSLQPAPTGVQPAQAPSVAPAGEARPSVVPESRVPARRRGTHPVALALIVMAGVFGGVAAYVLFTRPPMMPQVVVVQSPAPLPSGAGVAMPATADPDVPGAPAGTGTSQGLGKVAAVGGGPLPGKSADPKAGAVASAAPIDMAGFAGGTGKPAGPLAVGPGGEGASAGGGQLTAGEISGVVEAQKARVKRKCWQPALDARAKDGPSNARVSAMLTIGPSGNVDAVSASGGERDFPGLASCIASSVKGWKFPRSGGSTPANVPFVFASQ